MKFDFEKIKDRIVHAPLYYLIPAIVLVLVLVLAIARLIWFDQSVPIAKVASPQSSPALAVNVPVAKPAVPTNTPITPAVPAVTSSVSAQESALMVEPPTPGLAEPAELAPMKALYTLESAPAPGINAQPAWTEIGHKLIDARTANFQTLDERDLGVMIPASGLLRESWTFWVRAQGDGNWVTALKAGGYYQTTVTVQVDGRDVPALTARPWNNLLNTIATLRLGSGWHQVTIRFDQQIRQDQALMHGTAELFWRGPADASPVAIIPSAIDPTKAQPAVPKASAGARSAAPASALSTEPEMSTPPASTAGGAK